jgi:hypothetical protein
MKSGLYNLHKTSFAMETLALPRERVPKEKDMKGYIGI